MTVYLLVDGARIEPETAEDNVFRFPVSLPAKEIRLVSGSARPSELDPSSSDHRQLGVELKTMRWMQGEESIDVPIDSPGFIDGFHHCEYRGPKNIPVRWTTGNAGLPLDAPPDWRGATTLCLSVKEWDGSQNDPLDDTSARMLEAFQSLGEDCEFGLAQRYFNSEPPLTLLRWSGTTFKKLTRGLACRFEGLGDPETTEVAWSGIEYFLHTPFLSMHTNCITEQDEAKLAEIATAGRATLRLLRRKLLRDIQEARRIFVFASTHPDFGEPEILGLHAALRGVGPASLLCVRLAGSEDIPGRVERLADGLYAATIGEFGRPAGPFSQWLPICAAAMALDGRGETSAGPR